MLEVINLRSISAFSAAMRHRIFTLRNPAALSSSPALPFTVKALPPDPEADDLFRARQSVVLLGRHACGLLVRQTDGGTDVQRGVAEEGARL